MDGWMVGWERRNALIRYRAVRSPRREIAASPATRAGKLALASSKGLRLIFLRFEKRGRAVGRPY